jgi:hypothetical protein
MEAVENCAICRHGDRFTIEAMLASGAAVGAIAADFGVDPATVECHRARHMSRNPANGGLAGVLAALYDMQRRARIYEATAWETGRLRDALGALNEGRRIEESIVRLHFVLSQRPVPNPARR